MQKILTLTFNPTIDAASETERVQPTRKIRTYDESFQPGGGGINVARVIHRLGGDVRALYPCGGVMGGVLQELLRKRGVTSKIVPISGNIRSNSVIHEKSTGLEYRFIAQGPKLEKQEWQALLQACTEAEWDWLVVSGSLPRGVPETVYDQLVDLARQRQAKIAIDTSGNALRHALQQGGLSLVKPSQGEFEAYCGIEFENPMQIMEAAQREVDKGRSEIIAVTLGHQGAVLVSKTASLYLPSPHVRVMSASGAGDSFVGGMVHALAMGWDDEDAFRLGVACGSAAVIEKGTGLSQIDTIRRLYDDMRRNDRDFLINGGNA